jgi:hypothetical protein
MLPPTGSSVPNYNLNYGPLGQVQTYGQPSYHANNPAFESKWRQEGKGMFSSDVNPR